MNAPQPQAARTGELALRVAEVRAASERLCEPLAIEDYGAQSMPDASPLKWHLAHTTWFFETFVLAPHVQGHRPYQEGWSRLWNSYYEALGARQPRPQRALLTRPTVAEVYAYRAAIDEQLAALLARAGGAGRECLDLIELGLAHEQQHQELMLTDLQHAFFCNPLRPAYRSEPAAMPVHDTEPVSFIEHAGGLCSVGHDGTGFAFDNEGPQHSVHLPPFALSSRLVTAGEYTQFIDQGGYQRPELWLSDGWALSQSEGWSAPLYWERTASGWSRFTPYGMRALDAREPVCHVSFYEADAFARFAGQRLPGEHEWEMVARAAPQHGQFVDDGVLVPLAQGKAAGLLGATWVWTASPYVGYPGFVPAAGALGEYNGKFMVNQLVLRGGSCFSPRSHLRCTYRNFFPAHTRWQMTGIRLARLR